MSTADTVKAMTTVDIPLVQMILLYLFLLIPAGVILFLKLPTIKKMLISVIRMTVQLFLVGLYLRFLFEENNILLNLLWLFIMVTVASRHVLKSAHLKIQKLVPSVLMSLVSSVGIILFLFIISIIQPEPLYDARYLIPIGGMLLGNCLTANIIAVNTFSETIKQENKEIQTALTFGATGFESVLPYIRIAVHKAITPVVTTIGTLGLVSLPGMMTGQLLGGSFPVVAIKYQVAIMIAILSVTTLSVFLNVLFLSKNLFDERGTIREELYAV